MSSSFWRSSGTPGLTPAWTKKKSPQVKDDGNCWRKARCSGGSARLQSLDQLDLLLRGRIHRRRDAVGDQRQQAAIVAPLLQAGRVPEDLEQEDLVVALRGKTVSCDFERSIEEIKNGARVPTAVDIVAEKDLNGAFGAERARSTSMTVNSD